MSSNSNRAVWLSNTDNRYSDGFTGPVISPKIRPQVSFPHAVLQIGTDQSNRSQYIGATSNLLTQPLPTTRNRNKTLNATPWKNPASVGINRLPPSILRQIFLITANEDVVIRTLLLRVCESWRTLALGLSEMWAHVYLDSDRPGLFDSGFLGILRARSYLVRQREKEAKAEQLRSRLVARQDSGPMEIHSEEPEEQDHPPPPQAGPIRKKQRAYRVNSIDENLEAEVSWTDLETTTPLHIHLISPTRAQLSTLLYRARTTRWKSLYITLGRSELLESTIEEAFLGKEFPILGTLHVNEIVRTEWLNDTGRNHVDETVYGGDNYGRDPWAGTTAAGQIQWPRTNYETSPTTYNQGQPRTPWPTNDVTSTFSTKHHKSDKPWNRPTNEFAPPPRPSESSDKTFRPKDEELGSPLEEFWREMEENRAKSKSQDLLDQPKPKSNDLLDPSNSDWFDSHYDTKRSAFASTSPQYDYTTANALSATKPIGAREPLGLPTDPYASLYDAIAISAIKLNNIYVDADVTGVAQMYGLFGQQVRYLGGANSYIRNAISQHSVNTVYSHIRELTLYSWDSSLESLLACLPQLRYLDVEHYPDAAYIDTAMLVSSSKNGTLTGSLTVLLPSVTEIRLTNHSVALLSRICASGLTSLTIHEYDGSCDGCLPRNYRGKGRISHFFLDKWSCANIETAIFSIRVDITSLLTFLAPAFGLRSLTVTTPNPDLFDSTAADIYLDWKMQFVTAMSQFDTSSGTRSNPNGMLRYCPHLESLSLIIPGPYTDDEWGREANKIYEQRGRTKYLRSILLRFDGDGRQEVSGPANDLTVVEGFINSFLDA